MVLTLPPIMDIALSFIQWYSARAAAIFEVTGNALPVARLRTEKASLDQ